MDKILTAIASALAGAVLTWGIKAVQLEGRLEAIERGVQRIETRLFGPVK